MYKIIFTSLLIVCVGLPLALGTDVDACKNGKAKPIHVDIKGCDKQPCPLVRGQDVIMIMNFTATEPIHQLRARVIALVEGLKVPYRLPKPDVCEELINTHCPLEVNEPAIYRLEMPVYSWYPQINLRLTFSVRLNGRREDLVCFEVECIVQ